MTNPTGEALGNVKTKPYDQAFSSTEIIDVDQKKTVLRIGGLTKREYFAAMAMQGIYGNPFLMERMLKSPEEIEQKTTTLSVSIADALIRELNK